MQSHTTSIGNSCSGDIQLVLVMFLVSGEGAGLVEIITGTPDIGAYSSIWL